LVTGSSCCPRWSDRVTVSLLYQIAPIVANSDAWRSIATIRPISTRGRSIEVGGEILAVSIVWAIY